MMGGIIMNKLGNIIIYKDKDGNNNIEVKLQDNTVWLNQEQLVKLYNSSKSNISEHIKHIFEEGELDELSTVRKFRTVASNGKTYNMNYYNLDMIVAIGFRVNITNVNDNDYICISDFTKFKGGKSMSDDIIRNWLRNRITLEFLGTWKLIYNPNFNFVEFDGFRKNAGLHTFALGDKI